MTWCTLGWLGQAVSATALFVFGWVLAKTIGAPSPRGTKVHDAAFFRKQAEALAANNRELAQLSAEHSVRLAEERSARTDTLDRYGKAASASRMKDEFLHMVSRELRSPIQVIQGYADILKAEANLSPIGREAVAAIVRNSQLHLRVFSDLLDIVGLNTGKVSLKKVPVALKEVVGAVVATRQAEAESRSIRLMVKFPEDASSDVVLGDRSRLIQIVDHLVENAIKFSYPRGTVTISIVGHEAGLEVRVEDEGAGISAALLPLIFDRFRYKGQANIAKYAGLGLGLGVAYQLVELHGGHITASSPGPGRGSTFAVMLMRATEVPAPATVIESLPVSATQGTLVGLRVLVVDDSADLLLLVSRVLGNEGAIVATALSAAEAFTLVNDQTFDVLLSDISMPGEDGYSLLRRIHGIDHINLKPIATAAFTAFAAEEDRRRAIATGFDRHIAKPLSSEALIREVSMLAHLQIADRAIAKLSATRH